MGWFDLGSAVVLLGFADFVDEGTWKTECKQPFCSLCVGRLGHHANTAYQKYTKDISSKFNTYTSDPLVLSILSRMAEKKNDQKIRLFLYSCCFIVCAGVVRGYLPRSKQLAFEFKNLKHQQNKKNRVIQK